MGFVVASSSSFDAGNLALDFLNTRQGVGSRAADELASPAALFQWLSEADFAAENRLKSLRSSPPDARILLSEAQRLRHELGLAVHALAHGRPAPETTLMALNRILESRSTSLCLTREPGGLALVETSRVGDVHSVLAPVAEAGARLLVGGDPARIRQCHADDCAGWFVDTSKNGRRKWCSMARCGNRAKVAAHYRRHRER